MNAQIEALVYCNFCGKNHHRVKMMITGMQGVGICNECVVLCSDVISGKAEKREEATNEN